MDGSRFDGDADARAQLAGGPRHNGLSVAPNRDLEEVEETPIGDETARPGRADRAKVTGFPVEFDGNRLRRLAIGGDRLPELDVPQVGEPSRRRAAFVWNLIRRVVPHLNPGQHRLLQRHVDRAIEALREADRLLRGAAGDALNRCIKAIEAEMKAVEQSGENRVRLELATLSPRLVPYLEDPFAQALAFNLHCQRTGTSHSQGAKDWGGGAAAVAARNLVFLPPTYFELWKQGVLEKTRLVAVANRNLTPAAYLEIADLVRTRRREDVEDRLLRMPAASLQSTRRGPAEAMEAAARNGWLERHKTVELSGELVLEAGKGEPQAAVSAPDSEGTSASVGVASLAPPEDPAESASRALRAGLGGARLAPEVQQTLKLSPDPQTLVDRFLSAHRKTKDADPAELTKTLFFAHAGPMQKLVADDKLLLRHFRPVKTQKRGQLFYRLLEVIEEALIERQSEADLDARGITEQDAMSRVRKVLVELNKDPNRFLDVPDEWLGEVTRRHLYFGSRTRKEGAAYKWYRKIGAKFFLGAHKTAEEIAEKAARRAGRDAEPEGDATDADEDT